MLLLLSLLLSLASCTRADAPEGDAPSGAPSNETAAPIKYAYSETELNMNVSGADFFAYSGGRLYYDKRSAPGTAAIFSVSVEDAQASLDADDGAPVWERVYFLPNMSGYDVELGYSLQGLSVDADGNLFIATLLTFPDENDPNVIDYRQELIKVSPDGTELYSIDLAALPDGEPSVISRLETDDAGNVYLFDSSARFIYAFDGAVGELKFIIKETKDVYISDMSRSNDGTIIYAASKTAADPMQPSYYFTTFEMKTIDFARGASYGEPFKGAPERFIVEMLDGSGDYAFYFHNGTILYGVKPDSMTEEPVMNFLNSDIQPTALGELISTVDGEFLMLKNNGAARYVSRIVPNPNATLGDKVLLKMLVSSLYDQAMVDAVLNFNKTSRTARIEIDSYEYDLTKLDLALIGQDPPDLFNIISGARKYFSKGVLADLNPLLDADPNISREDLFENVLEASSADGKLYSITPAFTVQTLAGAQSIFGDVTSITPEELLEMADKYPDAAIYSSFNSASAGVTGQTAWIYQAVNTFSKYVNWDTGEVSFDSPEFISQLKLSERMPPAASLSSMSDYEKFFYNYSTNIREGRQLLENVYIDNPRVARTLETDLFGEPVSFVGTPTNEGSGNVIVAQKRLAISAKSKHPQEAWSFISSLLDENREYQYGGVYFINNREVKQEALSLNKNVFERRAREEMKPLTERDSSDGIVIYDYLNIQLAAYTVASLDEIDMTLPKYQNYALTEEEIDRVRSVIESADIFVDGDPTVNTILMEELEVFFAGAKTAEETAEIIQSRIALYVSEQG
jgi:ABC-type glycerol-3-phosphate transport system substrate-binding protein